jgi:hypothetical protein
VSTERRPFRFASHKGADDGSGDSDDDPILALGYVRNPFPEPGLDTGAFYIRHMEPQIKALETWVSDAQAATDPVSPAHQPVRPIAIRGSIGVGKTHVLKALEKDLSEGDGLAVTRKNLPEEGMERILLANLLLHNLPSGHPDTEITGEPSSVPILDRIVARLAGDRRPAIMTELEHLAPRSLFAQAFQSVVASGRDDYRAVLARWLSRGMTTPTQRAKIHLARPLEGEGQAIRAIADLLQLARAAGELQVWFVLVDQLEDLWRPGVVTPGRRARLLTDLRFLVDLALEGAPIATLLAWNTEVNAEDHIQVEYQALWRRLGTPVDLPGLGQKDVWPFAQEYLKHATVRKSATQLRSRRDRFRTALEARTPQVVRTLTNDPQARLGSVFASHRVLHHWRACAPEVAAELATVK